MDDWTIDYELDSRGELPKAPNSANGKARKAGKKKEKEAPKKITYIHTTETLEIEELPAAEIQIAPDDVEREVLAEWKARASGLWHPQWSREIPAPDDWSRLEIQNSAMPRTGFIPAYVNTMGKISDAPRVQHLAAAVAAVSAVMGPGIRFPLGTDIRCTIGANVYCMALAGTGIRKSFSFGTLQRYLPEGLHAKWQPASNASLVQLLGKDYHKLWMLDEVGGFLATLTAQYNTSLPQSLCAIFDGTPVENNTVTRGNSIAVDPYLTFLSATVLGVIFKLDAQTLDLLFSGGFFGRTLFFPCVKTSSKLHPAGVPESLERGFRRFLRGVYRQSPRRTAEGEQPYVLLEFSREAFKELYRWHVLTHLALSDEEIKKNVVVGDPPNAFIAPLWERLVPMIKKVAAIYHVSLGGTVGSTKISADTTVRAIKLVYNYCLPALAYVARKAAEGDWGRCTSTHLTDLRKSPRGLLYTELPARWHVTARKRDDILGTIAPYVHFELWHKVRKTLSGEVVPKRGRAHYVVVAGDAALSEKARKGEARRKGGKRVEPPIGVRKQVAEFAPDEAARMDRMPVNVEKAEEVDPCQD